MLSLAIAVVGIDPNKIFLKYLLTLVSLVVVIFYILWSFKKINFIEANMRTIKHGKKK